MSYTRKPVRVFSAITATGISEPILKYVDGGDDLDVKTTLGGGTLSMQPEESPDPYMKEQAYDGGTGTVGPAIGDTFRGEESGAVGLVVNVTGASPQVSGTVTLKHVLGTFKDNEKIRGTSADSDILINGAATAHNNWSNIGSAIVAGGQSTVTGINFPFVRLNVGTLSTGPLTVVVN